MNTEQPGSVATTDLESGAALRNEHDCLQDILHGMERACDADYTAYKTGCLLRRVDKRMTELRLDSLEDYAAFFRTHPEEALALSKELLSGATSFFRDPEAYASLYTQVLPELCSAASGEGELRVWVVGCSTGEEAYSIAIQFHRYMERNGIARTVKILATDIDKDSLAYASQGMYPATIAEQVPDEILARYFRKQGSSYQVISEIRRMVVFAAHNVFHDPPYINLDLVSCRNMLVYFQPDMQCKVMTQFHYALKENAFLFLGPSESIGKLAGLYSRYDTNWNIFRRKPVKRFRHVRGTVEFKRAEAATIYPGTKELLANRKNEGVLETLLEDYLPACLILDENQTIVHLGGNVTKYLTIAKGRPSLHISKMVSAQLGGIIGSALHQLKADKEAVTYRDLHITCNRETLAVHLTVKPFRPDNDRLTIVLFEDAAQEDGDEPFDPQKKWLGRLAELNADLEAAQGSMRETLEELEAANRELVEANETLTASIDELQAANEDMKSLNEELVAVNMEYHQIIRELTDISNDMDNFLESTKIGTIFLDNRLRVKRYTPAVTKEINLMPVDIGRPLEHISHRLRSKSMISDAKIVLETLVPLEKEVQSKSGSWYRVNILPYRSVDPESPGVIITFVDISEIKSTNDELQKMSYAIEQSPSIVVITDTRGRIEYVNPKFTEQTGYMPHEVIGRNMSELHPSRVTPRVFAEIWSIVQSGNKWTGEMESERKNKETYWEGVSILPIKNPDGEMIHVLRVSQDITERKNTEELLRKSEMLSAVGQLAAGIAHEIRNPLTALKGFTKLLDAGTSNKTYTQIMTAELDRIESIISELLVLAKPQIWNYHKKDIVYVLQDVIMLLDTQAIMKNVEIVTAFDLDIPNITCVENQLKQVFINILKNGIEAMPDGGRLTVSVERQDAFNIRLQFIDEGCGIPEDKIPKLGEPFYSTKEKGTGLGLMVSFKIIENHRGTISIKSELGKGTNVEIVLPIDG